MRTILFRGKIFGPNMRLYNMSNSWWYGDLIQYADGTVAIRQQETGMELEVDKKTVGQFTGLHDKNASMIFEGDVIHVKEFFNTAIHFTSEERDFFELEDLKGSLRKEYKTDVNYESGCFVINTSKEDDYYDCFASVLDGNQKHSQPIFEALVIGNIHEKKI